MRQFKGAWGSHSKTAAHSELITCRWRPHYLQPSTNQRILHMCERGYCDSDVFESFWQLVCCQCYNQLRGTKEAFQFNYEKFPQSSVKIYTSHTNQGFSHYSGDSSELRVMIMDWEIMSNSLTFYLLWYFFFLMDATSKFPFQFSDSHPAARSQIVPKWITNHMGLHLQEGTLTPERRQHI